LPESTFLRAFDSAHQRIQRIFAETAFALKPAKSPAHPTHPPSLDAQDSDMLHLQLKVQSLFNEGAASALERGKDYLRLMKLYCKQGRLEEAKKAAAEAVKFSSTSPSVLAKVARFFFSQQHFMIAFQTMRQAIDLNPNLPFHQSLFAEILNALGHHDQALEAVQKAIVSYCSLNDTLGDHSLVTCQKRHFHLLLAKTLAALGWQQEAIASINEAMLLAEKPEPSLYLALGDILPTKEERLMAYQKAAAIIQRTHPPSPDHLMLLKEIATRYFQQGDVDLEIAMHEEAALLFGGLTNYMDLGDTLYSAKKYSHALEAYSKALECDPTHEDIWYNIGSAYLKLGCYEASFQTLQRAPTPPTPYSSHSDCIYKKGLALLRMGYAYQAHPFFQEAAKLEPENALYGSHLKEAIQQFKSPPLTRADLESLFSTNPWTPKVELTAKEKLDEIAALQEAFSRTGLLELGYRIAQLHVEIGQRADAALLASKYGRMAFHEPQLLYQFLRLLQELQQPGKACALLEQFSPLLLDLAQQNTPLFHRYVLLWAELQEPKKALSFIEQALVLIPQHPLLHYAHAQALDYLNRLQDALQAIERAIELDENAAPFYALKGSFLVDLGLPGQGQFYQAFNRIQAEDQDVLDDLIRVFIDTEDKKFARLALKKRCQLFPSDWAYQELGRHYCLEKRYQKAMNAYSRVESPGVQENLEIASLHLKLGNAKEALKAFSRAPSLSQADCCYRIGRALSQLGLFQEASWHFKRATLIDPLKERYAIHLRASYSRLPKTQK
jgi:tetratricopeptide (TPR) repeat protein